MDAAPLVVIHHQLNLTGQNVLTFVSWALTLVLLGVTIQMGRRERTPFYVLIVVASMVGAFAEALYDEAFSLYFYSTHGMQSFYTAFDVPQPAWTHSGYAVLYALPAVLITYRIRNGGLAPRALYGWAGVEFAMSCVFEMTGINIGTYTYWGPHVFRVFHYPLAVGVLEAAQTICFAVAAAQLRQRTASPWGLLGLFVVFPATFFAANFGAGSAVIIAIHASNASRLAVYLCTLLSIVFAIALIRFAAAVIPKTGHADAGRTAPAEPGTARPSVENPSASGSLSSGNALPGSLEGALG
jgi:hypothetical protein